VPTLAGESFGGCQADPGASTDDDVGGRTGVVAYSLDGRLLDRDDLGRPGGGFIGLTASGI